MIHLSSSTFINRSIWLLIIVLFIIPLYIDYDFDNNGETLFFFDSLFFASIHSLLLILWIINCFSKNKTVKIISRILILLISAFYFILAYDFVCIGAKHLNPLYGSYVMFIFFPLFSAYFIKVKARIHDGS